MNEARKRWESDLISYPEEAPPKKATRPKKVTITDHGVEGCGALCLAEVAKKHNVSHSTVWARYRAGKRGKDLISKERVCYRVRVMGCTLKEWADWFGHQDTKRISGSYRYVLRKVDPDAPDEVIVDLWLRIYGPKTVLVLETPWP